MRTIWFLLLFVQASTCTGRRSRIKLELEHGGQQRTAVLFRPTVQSSASPVLMALHPNNGKPEWGDQFRGEAEALSYLLLVPHGYRRSWNAGPCCGAAKDLGIDDVGFLWALLDSVIKEHGGRRDAIFVLGHSNGGFMSTTLAATRPPTSALQAPQITAIAPTAGFNPNIKLSPAPSAGIAVFLQMSKVDTVVKFNGCCERSVCSSGIRSDTCVAAPDMFDRYQSSNTCNASEELSTGPEHPGVARVRCMSGVGCGAATSFCAWTTHSHDAMGTKSVACGGILFFALVSGESVEALSNKRVCHAHLPLPLLAKIAKSAISSSSALRTSRAVTNSTTTFGLELQMPMPESSRSWFFLAAFIGILFFRIGCSIK